MTGYFVGDSREGLERARQTQCYSRIIHLAKLNPNCHMNYHLSKITIKILLYTVIDQNLVV